MSREEKELNLLKQINEQNVDKGILVNDLYLETIKAKLKMLDEV